MDSQDGLNIYIDVTELNTLDVREDDLRVRFRDAILDKNHGLRCILFKHINGHQYIILDNDEFDMVPFLQEITFDDEMVKTNADQRLLPLLTSDFMQTVIKHMDTEFDKTLAMTKMITSQMVRTMTRINTVTPLWTVKDKERSGCKANSQII